MVQLRQLLVDYLIRASKEAVKVVGESHYPNVHIHITYHFNNPGYSIHSKYVFYNGAKSNTVSFYT